MSLVITKQLNDPAKRIEDLVDGFDRRLRRQFLNMVANIKDDMTLTGIERLLSTGQVSEALDIAEAHVRALASQANQAFITSAESTAALISGEVLVTFDLTNFRAADIMRQNQLNLVREFTQEQRNATRAALVEGSSQGLNPRAQARLFRESMGLTESQQQAVLNYERLLRENSSRALDRQLRDKRFDRSVERAIRTDQPLKSTQINRMVDRYREKYVQFRSETIARTEALSAANEGANEMFQQAIDSGALPADKIEREWHTADDSRVRDEHDGMNGQKRPFGEPFVSDDGVSLRYPGDRNAPADERINCRCALSTRLKE